MTKDPNSCKNPEHIYAGNYPLAEAKRVIKALEHSDIDFSLEFSHPREYPVSGYVHSGYSGSHSTATIYVHPDDIQKFHDLEVETLHPNQEPVPQQGFLTWLLQKIRGVGMTDS